MRSTASRRMIRRTTPVARSGTCFETRRLAAPLLWTRDGQELKRSENLGERLSMREHKIGRGGNVVDRGVRQSAGRLRGVADQRDNVWVIGIHRRLAVGGAEDLDLRVRIALEALDQDEVDGS